VAFLSPVLVYHPVYHCERFLELLSASRQKGRIGGLGANPLISLVLVIKSGLVALSSRG
jgi:hypothetical protein